MRNPGGLAALDTLYDSLTGLNKALTAGVKHAPVPRGCDPECQNFGTGLGVVTLTIG